MVRSGDWITQGWQMVKPYLGTYVLTALVAGLLSGVTLGILTGPLSCGLIMMFLRQRREPEYEPQFGDLWKGFEVFAQSFVAWLIIAILLSVASGLVGGIASIVEALPIVGQLLAPMVGAVLGICAMVVFLYVFPLVADRRANAIEAIQQSAETTAKEFLPFAGFALILYVLQAIGAALCGVGLLLAGPVVVAAIAASYEDVLGAGGSAPVASEPAPAEEPLTEEEPPQ